MLWHPASVLQPSGGMGGRLMQRCWRCSRLRAATWQLLFLLGPHFLRLEQPCRCLARNERSPELTYSAHTHFERLVLATSQVTPRLLVHGYGRRDSPRLQSALSAAVQLTAAVLPDVAVGAVREVGSATPRHEPINRCSNTTERL